MIHLIVTVEIHHQRLSEFLRLVTTHQQASQREPGCERFDVLRSGFVFCLNETWNTEADLARHRQSAHYLRWKTELPLLEVRHQREEYRTLRTVLTCGCFDGPQLHAGHIAVLAEAARLGDFLVIALNSDASVRRLKGPARPIVPEPVRVARLERLPCPNRVVVFDTEGELRQLCRDLMPDYLVKGSDWRGQAITGAEFANAVHFVERLPGVSTTALAASAAC